MMRIAVIGTGNVGRVLARRWAEAGYEVVFGSRRAASDEIRALAEAAGATAATPDAAVQEAEVVVLATPWSATQAVVAALGALAGKILIDCTNPLGANLTSALPAGESGAEHIAQWAPGARVVKAFNTTGAANMADPLYGAQRLALFVCGDDAEAKAVAMTLAEVLGFEAIDHGALRQARYLEALAMIWITQAYQQGRGPNFGFALLQR